MASQSMSLSIPLVENYVPKYCSWSRLRSFWPAWFTITKWLQICLFGLSTTILGIWYVIHPGIIPWKYRLQATDWCITYLAKTSHNIRQRIQLGVVWYWIFLEISHNPFWCYEVICGTCIAFGQCLWLAHFLYILCTSHTRTPQRGTENTFEFNSIKDTISSCYDRKSFNLCVIKYGKWMFSLMWSWWKWIWP